MDILTPRIISISSSRPIIPWANGGRFCRNRSRHRSSPFRRLQNSESSADCGATSACIRRHRGLHRNQRLADQVALLRCNRYRSTHAYLFYAHIPYLNMGELRNVTEIDRLDTPLIFHESLYFRNASSRLTNKEPRLQCSDATSMSKFEQHHANKKNEGVETNAVVPSLRISMSWRSLSTPPVEIIFAPIFSAAQNTPYPPTNCASGDPICTKSSGRIPPAQHCIAVASPTWSQSSCDSARNVGLPVVPEVLITWRISEGQFRDNRQTADAPPERSLTCLLQSAPFQ